MNLQETNLPIKFLVIGAVLTIFVIAVYKAATRKPELPKRTRIYRESAKTVIPTEQNISSTEKPGEEENTDPEV